ALQARGVEFARAAFATGQVWRCNAADRKLIDEHGAAQILGVAIRAAARDGEMLAARDRLGVSRDGQRGLVDVEALRQQRVAATVNEAQRDADQDDKHEQQFPQKANDLHIVSPRQLNVTAMPEFSASPSGTSYARVRRRPAASANLC